MAERHHQAAPARDSSARPPLAKAGAERKLELEALLTTLPGMAYRCRNDPKWTMEFVSDGATDLTGYAPDDLVENHRIAYGDLIHPDDQDSVWEAVQEAIRERRSFQITYRLVTPAGEKVVWEQGVGLFSNGNELAGIEGYVSDISDRTRLEERVLENERLAAIGSAASVFAHEVGNPLNNMFLQGQMLERKVRRLGLEDELGPALSSVMSEIRRLNHLLGEFRGLSRRQKIELRPLSIAALIDDVISLVQTGKAIAVATAVDPDLPRIVGSQDKLKQVLLNLCKNAVEAMEAQGGTLTVSATRKGDEAIRLSVSDTGPGLPAEFDVFEPFRTTKEHGTGLGLPIAKQIVVGHSGSITHESVSGRGATFHVTLPIDPRRQA